MMSSEEDNSVFLPRSGKPTVTAVERADDDVTRIVMPTRGASPRPAVPAGGTAAAVVQEDDESSCMVMPTRPAVPAGAAAVAQEDDEASCMVSSVPRPMGAAVPVPSPSSTPVSPLLSNDPLKEGELLNGGVYQIKSVMGQGGFGITYRAFDSNLKIDVVIKENFPSSLAQRNVENQSIVSRQSGAPDDPYLWTLDNFSKEAQTIAAVGARKMHPNIVNVLNFFPERNTAYYVMRYVHGRPLSKAIDAYSWDENSVKPLLLNMLSGLEYLHANGIFHLDIKPANILLQEDGNPVLIDFGAAMSGGANDSSALIYSKGYAPPEQRQYETAGQIGAWSDIYALGATLYHLVAGTKPADTPQPLLPRVAELPGYSAEFLGSIDKAMNSEICARWQSAREWMDYFAHLEQQAAEARQRQQAEQSQAVFLKKYKEQEQEHAQRSRQQKAEMVQAHQKQLEDLKKQHELQRRKQAAETEKAVKAQIEELKIQHEKEQQAIIKEARKLVQQAVHGGSGFHPLFEPYAVRQACISAIKRMFTYSGRSSRSETLKFSLTAFALFIVLTLLAGTDESSSIVLPMLWFVVSGVLLLAFCAAVVRRLHDTGRSAWWCLVALIPSIGWIVLLILLLLPTKEEVNKYGAGPLPPL